MFRWLGLWVGVLSVLVLATPTMMSGQGWTPPPPPIEFDEVEVFIVLNTTDDELRFEFSVEAEFFKFLLLRDPNGNFLYSTSAWGNLRRAPLGLDTLGVQSVNVPTFTLSVADFLAKFPEGDYKFRGRTTDGTRLKSEAELTHVIPGIDTGVNVTAPTAGSSIDSTMDLTVSWDTVTDPVGVNIVFYDIILMDDDTNETVFSAQVGSGVTSITIPAEFLEPGLEYDLRVIAEEISGNRGLAEVDFESDP